MYAVYTRLSASNCPLVPNKQFKETMPYFLIYTRRYALENLYITVYKYIQNC